MKCDDMGKWTHKGSPKRTIVSKIVEEEVVIRLVDKDEELFNLDEGERKYVLKRTYYENASSKELKKMFVTLTIDETFIPVTLIQYNFKGKEHDVSNILPHGNSKNTAPYIRLQASTLRNLEATTVSSKKPKTLLDEN